MPLFLLPTTPSSPLGELFLLQQLESQEELKGYLFQVTENLLIPQFTPCETRPSEEGQHGPFTTLVSVGLCYRAAFPLAALAVED